jgi:hypothetical protein
MPPNGSKRLQYEERHASDSVVSAARKWCAVRGIGFEVRRRKELNKRTTLRDNRRRLIGCYKAETYTSRFAEINRSSDELLRLLRSEEPCTLSQLLTRSNSRVLSDLANVAVAELVRKGDVDADLANRPFDGGSTLTFAANRPSRRT